MAKKQWKELVKKFHIFTARKFKSEPPYPLLRNEVFVEDMADFDICNEVGERVLRISRCQKNYTISREGRIVFETLEEDIMTKHPSALLIDIDTAADHWEHDKHYHLAHR